MRVNRLLETLTFAALLAVSSTSYSDTYPSRPISLIIAYPPGGSVDLMGRVTAPIVSAKLGQPIVIENLSGGLGIPATEKVVKAAPDGYTIQIASGREINIAKLVSPNVPYNGEQDLAPISLLGTSTMVLVGGPKIKATTFEEMIAFARNNPGTVSYATPGAGSPMHFVGELIKLRNNVDLTHVPYKGAAPMMADVLGGHTDLGVFVLSSALPNLASGKIRAYGVTESVRSPAASQIPALAEFPKMDGVNMTIWFGVLAPLKTPPAIVQRLSKEFADALKDPSVAAKLAEQGIVVHGSTPQAFADFLRADTQNYRTIVERAKIRFE